MTERICYLHVGTGKTGSSAIQYALTKAHNELLSCGYLYPDLSKHFQKVLDLRPTAGNASKVNRALRGERVQAALELIRPFADSPEHLVLSCEGLARIRSSALEAFGAGLQSMGYATRCLVFFRPQVEYILSSYLQLVKANKVHHGVVDHVRSRLSPERHGSIDWYDKACTLQRAFGEGNISVRWYPAVRRLGPEAIVKAVFAWLGLPSLGSGLLADSITINPTPGREALMVLQAANSSGLGGKRFADGFLLEAHRAEVLGTKVTLERSLVEMIDRATRKHNLALLERYCPDLSPDEELELPEATEEPVNAAIVRELTKIACGILVQREGAKPELVERLRQRVMDMGHHTCS